MARLARRKPKPKEYKASTRLRWAAQFPLKPGEDILARRGLMVILADISVSGEFCETDGELAARAGISESSVRELRDKLCAEGALEPHKVFVEPEEEYRLNMPAAGPLPV